MISQQDIKLYDFTETQVNYINIQIEKAFMEWRIDELKYWRDRI